MHVEPIVAPLVAKIAFALSDLVGMVGECIINAAGMNIQILPQMLHGNAGAFNMPAGITHTPGRIPLECLVFKLALGKPQDKVILILLIGILFHTFTNAHIQVFLVVIVKHIILFQRGSIKVHIAPNKVCLTGIQKPLHHVNIRIDAVGSRLHHLRTFDIELITISKKRICVELGDLHNGFILSLGTLEHFIFASIRIGSQMANIGNIHNPLNIVANITKSLF